MKIKSRSKLISEYNEKYQDRPKDLETALRSYINERNGNIDKACAKARKKAVEIIEKRKYRTINITMYEYPMKTDRPRAFNDHLFSPNAKANKDYFRKALKSVIDDIKLINTPAEIEISAYLEMPSSVPLDEVILFESKLLQVVDKPDYDNIGKCYTDMLTDVLISDDDIFYRGTINKYYSVVPRVEIRLTFLDKHESKFIYKKLAARKSIKAAINNGSLILEEPITL